MIFTFPPMDPDPRDPGLPLTYKFLDNTTLQTMQHCWRHYWYSSVLGLRRDGEESVHLTFGTLIHDGADAWCKMVANGVPPEEATQETLAFVLQASWAQGAERDVFGGQYVEVFQCTDRTKTNTKKGIVRCLWSKAEHLGAKTQCECGRPVESRTAYVANEKYKNRRSLARAMVALCDQMAASDVQTIRHADGRVASELRWFQPLGVEGTDGQSITMTGSFDSVGADPAGRTIVREYKTTRRQPDEKFWAGYEMSPQVHTYTWAAQREFGPGTQVHVYAIHIGVGFVEVYVKPVYLAPGGLSEWQGEMEHYVQEGQIRARLAVEAAQQGRDPASAYPRRLSACASLPGAPTTPCPYRDFCRLDPSDRETFLESNFKQEPWNCLAPKGAQTGDVE